jgi:hypothetical protein
MARFGLLLGSRCSWFFLPSPQLSPGRGLLGLALRYLNYEGLLSTYCFDISFATQLLRRERMLAWVTKDPSYETPNHGIQGIFSHGGLVWEMRFEVDGRGLKGILKIFDL